MTIIPDGLSIRPVANNDIEWLFGLRNNPEFAKWFRYPGRVSYPEHQAWFKQILNRGRDLFDVIEVDGVPAGYVRLDSPSSADGNLLKFEVSIGVDPSFQGEGLAAILLHHALNQHYEEGKIVEYAAQVNELNTASRHLFLKFNFDIDVAEIVLNGFATYRLRRDSIG